MIGVGASRNAAIKAGAGFGTLVIAVVMFIRSFPFVLVAGAVISGGARRFSRAEYRSVFRQ
ncbi:MAG TPA: hypothetical protein VFX03_07030 [Thermomicrobiales bacterium]|nr:hypothetical protein [Thermomicrobiales bacterium]